MPAIIESSSTADQEITQERHDSTFTYERRDSLQLPEEEMERLSMSRSTDHLRKDSVDSGIGSPLTFRVPAAGAMKRSTSATVQSQNRTSSGGSISVNEQTQLLLQKMLILEQKLNSMDSQLKNEQVQRLALEAKIVKLERDNEQLKMTRQQAGMQLQNFAEIFYSETETIKLTTGSATTSPHPSLAELRRSRTDSLSSSSSLQSRGSRYSNASNASA